MMKKKKAPAAALSVFSAVLTAGTICAASVLPAFPVFAAAVPNGNTAMEASQSETAGSTAEAASKSETAASAVETAAQSVTAAGAAEAASQNETAAGAAEAASQNETAAGAAEAASQNETAAGAAEAASESVTAAGTAEAASESATAADTAETDPVRQLLEEYAGKLDNLYGKTYTGYLWDVKKEEFSSRQGYDTTEIPASDAAFRIDDFDQDGTAELLVVSVKEDSTLKLTMYEVVDGQEIFPADSYDAAAKQYEKDFRIYAAEQGSGYTSVFSYDKGGPCIGIDSLGFGMQATGRIRTILTVKYDGNHFLQEGEAYIDRTSGNYFNEAGRTIRGKLESFGTNPLMDTDVERIFLGYAIDKYLPDAREIMRTDTVTVYDTDQYSEWLKKGAPDKLEATSIHFAEQNELYSREMNDRFSGMLSSHIGRELKFADELGNQGTVDWSTELIAYGESGNLFKSGYTYVSPDEEAREKEVEFKYNKLSLYFWETEEGIWLLPEMKDEERAILLKDGTLPENAVLVYSETEHPDPLEPSAEGDHRSIEKYSGNIQAYSDIVIYRAYNIPGKDLESRDCTNIIWKKDTGLIGYQHSRTPAGADLIRARDSMYVKVDDMRLDVK